MPKISVVEEELWRLGVSSHLTWQGGASEGSDRRLKVKVQSEVCVLSAEMPKKNWCVIRAKVLSELLGNYRTRLRGSLHRQLIGKLEVGVLTCCHD